MEYPELERTIIDLKRRDVEDIMKDFKVSDKTLETIKAIHCDEMRLGLSASSEDRKKSSLQMENTYVRHLLTGKECGDYLALDLGGTMFRVLLVILDGSGMCKEKVWRDEIPESVLTGTCASLMDYIAESIQSFLKQEQLVPAQSQPIPLGFTFSFPMEQKAINVGFLVTWTKTFRCTDGVGKDAAKELQDAISRRQELHVKVMAILNDTTGTLMAGNYADHSCKVGAIVGTGFNCCYMQDLGGMPKWSGDMGEPRQVAVDTENGAFGDNGCLDFMKTEFDVVVNKQSNHVDSFTFEKMFSGHYQGELIRNVLVKLTSKGCLFSGKGSADLFKPGSFNSEHASRIVSDPSCTKLIFEKLHITSENYDDDDALIVHYVCQLIATRGAYLVAAAIASILTFINEPTVTIAVDGSLFELHPTFRKLMEQKVAQLEPGVKCKFILAKDGSGKGAGLVAAVASKQL